jgi:hypothetical protein
VAGFGQALAFASAQPPLGPGNQAFARFRLAHPPQEGAYFPSNPSFLIPNKKSPLSASLFYLVGVAGFGQALAFASAQPPLGPGNQAFARFRLAHPPQEGAYFPSNPSFLIPNKKGPLSASLFYLVGVAGFEPTTSSSRTKRASQAALHPDKLSLTTTALDIMAAPPRKRRKGAKDSASH